MSYIYDNNDVTYYDENNKGKLYDYNGIGQLISIKDLTTDKILASYTYNGNLLMESATIGRSKLEIDYNVLDEVTAKRVLDSLNSNAITYEEKYQRNDRDGYQEFIRQGDGSIALIDIMRQKKLKI